MDLQLFSRKPNFNKKIRQIDKKIENIDQTAVTISQSIVSITQTNKILTQLMTKFKEQDYTIQKGRIDAISSLDEDYKEKLKKSLDDSKASSIKTLEPLIQQAAKIEGGMIAAEVKAKNSLMQLTVQRKILSSGKMQLGILEEIEKEGLKNELEIQEMVRNLEQVNGMTKDFLIGYADSSKAITDILNRSSTGVSGGDPEMQKLFDQLKVG